MNIAKFATATVCAAALGFAAKAEPKTTVVPLEGVPGGSITIVTDGDAESQIKIITPDGVQEIKPGKGPKGECGKPGKCPKGECGKPGKGPKGECGKPGKGPEGECGKPCKGPKGECGKKDCDGEPIIGFGGGDDDDIFSGMPQEFREMEEEMNRMRREFERRFGRGFGSGFNSGFGRPGFGRSNFGRPGFGRRFGSGRNFGRPGSGKFVRESFKCPHCGAEINRQSWSDRKVFKNGVEVKDEEPAACEGKKEPVKCPNRACRKDGGKPGCPKGECGKPGKGPNGECGKPGKCPKGDCVKECKPGDAPKGECGKKCECPKGECKKGCKPGCPKGECRKGKGPEGRRGRRFGKRAPGAPKADAKNAGEQPPPPPPAEGEGKKD